MARAKRANSLAGRDGRRALAFGAARGAALFFGLYSLANALATARSADTTQDLWWIDLRVLPGFWAPAFGVAAALLLIAFALSPKMAPWRRWLTALACAALCALALQNTAAFYRVWGAGSFRPAVPMPFSLVVAIAFAAIGWCVWQLRPARGRALAATVALVVAAVACVALFPIAQQAFFGTSDYRAKADAAVIFGARVMSGGALSTSLRDRMTTGIALYKAGLVRKLVMSGAVGSSGFDEPIAMRDAAMKAGVPADDILLDHYGADTDATVRNTTRLFSHAGLRRILAVSQGYHLPRVKLAYRAAGWDVRTVPAGTSTPIVQTPLYVVREIPAFWTYWLRALVRDVRGG